MSTFPLPPVPPTTSYPDQNPVGVQPHRFDGETLVEQSDHQPRLSRQVQAVYDAVKDGQWRGLASIAVAAGCPEASASARLRDLRKPRFGGYVIERRHLGAGVYQYRLLRHG